MNTQVKYEIKKQNKTKQNKTKKTKQNKTKKKHYAIEHRKKGNFKLAANWFLQKWMKLWMKKVQHFQKYGGGKKKKTMVVEK